MQARGWSSPAAGQDRRTGGVVRGGGGRDSVDAFAFFRPRIYIDGQRATYAQ